MTNRDYILQRIAALDDDALDGIFEDYILPNDEESKKLKSICKWCADRHGGKFPCGRGVCIADVGEYMSAEAVFV